jgi:hypothetical protein
MSALAVDFQKWDEEPDICPVSVIYTQEGWQIDQLPMNYQNILGSSRIDRKAYLDRCPELEHLILELGERAATHLIVDTAMFKTEYELMQSDGWWGSYED